MMITLYRYSGKANVVNKTMPTGSGNVLTITADYGFEGNQNIDNIYINIDSSTRPMWTYAYIDSFERYYFVTNIVWLSGNLWRLSLRCDVLNTYATTITSQEGTILYSGSGDARLYDPRLVYNQPPTKTKITPLTTLTDVTQTDGSPSYIVMAVRYMDYRSPSTPGVDWTTNNQMRYIIFTPETYQAFVGRYYNLIGSNEPLAVAIANTICSVTVVRWLNMASFTKTTFVSFGSPEIFKIKNERYPAEVIVQTDPDVTPDCWQISAEDYHAKRYVAFADYVSTYAQRKAQRLIDIPYVGQINVDLDNLGLPATLNFIIGVEISYDFGGNQYVVSLGTGPSNAGTAASISYQHEDYTTFPNNYSANFISDSSYSAEKETRNAQILSLVGTAVTGLVSGIVTEGATIPATVASLGIGAANFSLAEQKLEYQKAASLKMNGTSTGGSPYNTMVTYVVTPQPHVAYPDAAMFKKTSNSSTYADTFQATYGKPDGQYRTLSTLTGTGFCQMGTVSLTGFSSATEAELMEIKNLLLSGVIL